jgi:hypothetical protein
MYAMPLRSELLDYGGLIAFGGAGGLDGED